MIVSVPAGELFRRGYTETAHSAKNRGCSAAPLCGRDIAPGKLTLRSRRAIKRCVELPGFAPLGRPCYNRRWRYESWILCPGFPRTFECSYKLIPYNAGARTAVPHVLGPPPAVHASEQRALGRVQVVHLNTLTTNQDCLWPGSTNRGNSPRSEAFLPELQERSGR